MLCETPYETTRGNCKSYEDIMNLIKKTDPQYFEQTSDKPYNRHNYKVIKSTGEHVVVESWEQAQSIWWNSPPHFLSHIEVLDKKEAKGFK